MSGAGHEQGTRSPRAIRPAETRSPAWPRTAPPARCNNRSIPAKSSVVIVAALQTAPPPHVHCPRTSSFRPFVHFVGTRRGYAAGARAIVRVLFESTAFSALSQSGTRLGEGTRMRREIFREARS